MRIGILAACRRRVVGGGLATPTVTNVSATGASPLVLALSDGDYVAGKYLQWEIAASLTPAKNGDGSYTTTAQKGVTFIDGDSWARLDLALGYNTPSGAFAFHCRVLQNDESGLVTVTDQNGVTATYDASGWSTDYTDTIVVSVAVLSTTGTKKTPYLNISNGNLSWVHNNNVGQLCASLATIPSQNSKWHTEASIDGWNSGGVWYCGISDGSIDFSSPGSQAGGSSTFPGNTGAGLTFQIAPGGTVVGWSANNTTGFANLPQAAAVGDRLIIEVDQTAKTFDVYWYTLATNSVSAKLGTATLTSAPSSWNFFGGGSKGTATVATSDSGTWYVASASWKMTPSTGFNTIYG